MLSGAGMSFLSSCCSFQADKRKICGSSLTIMCQTNANTISNYFSDFLKHNIMKKV